MDYAMNPFMLGYIDEYMVPTVNGMDRLARSFDADHAAFINYVLEEKQSRDERARRRHQ